MFELSSRSDVEKVSRTPADSVNSFHVWVARDYHRFDVTEAEFTSLLGIHLTQYVLRKPNEEITLEEIRRLGLTESVSDSNLYCIIGDGEWDIETIFLDAGSSYFGIDVATHLHYCTLLYTLKISGAGDSTTRKVVDNLFQFGERDRVSAYMSID